jgi:peptidoglycan/LPS O-acetylase OafA/YrhL
LNKVNHKRHFNNLNSTRFIAFLPVFFTHCFYTNSKLIKNNVIYLFVQNHLKIGLLSLDYFFVLSSFLITWIILEEYKNLGRFYTLNFYIRRTLRIFPLYFFVVLIGFSISFFGGYFSALAIKPLPEFYNFLFFILNFYMMEHGFNFLFFLTFFWSVSIEEQFYIFWAIVLKFARSYLSIIAIILIVASIYFRATHLNNNSYLVFHTISSMGNFGVGSLLAYLFFNKPKLNDYINKG